MVMLFLTQVVTTNKSRVLCIVLERGEVQVSTCYLYVNHAKCLKNVGDFLKAVGLQSLFTVHECKTLEADKYLSQ